MGAILRCWTVIKGKPLVETLESLSKSIKDCLLISKAFSELHQKGYHVFKEDALEYCVRSVKIEIP